MPASGPILVLASASPSRLALLRAAGLDPLVVPSDVDETGVGALPVRDQVGELARRKARAVAGRDDLPPGALVLGCDSLLELDGVAVGKPGTDAEVRARWAVQAGRTGTLWTGHALILAAPVHGGEAVEVVGSTVRFGRPTEGELEAYVATGEAQAVSGAFTLEGYGAAFVDGIDGDPGAVMGCSVPALRRLLSAHGVAITDLWARPA